MWFGDGGGESAKFWMVVLTELRNRGVAGATNRRLTGIRSVKSQSQPMSIFMPSRSYSCFTPTGRADRRRG